MSLSQMSRIHLSYNQIYRALLSSAKSDDMLTGYIPLSGRKHLVVSKMQTAMDLSKSKCEI